jgi:hypothetical protein
MKDSALSCRRFLSGGFSSERTLGSVMLRRMSLLMRAFNSRLLISKTHEAVQRMHKTIIPRWRLLHDKTHNTPQHQDPGPGRRVAALISAAAAAADKPSRRASRVCSRNVFRETNNEDLKQSAGSQGSYLISVDEQRLENVKKQNQRGRFRRDLKSSHDRGFAGHPRAILFTLRPQLEKPSIEVHIQETFMPNQKRK